MTRLRGWAPKGERLVDKVPQGKWKTATFLAALRNDRIDAPCLFDGPINGERFRAYVEQFLVPTLKPGDAVILDNLGSPPSGCSWISLSMKWRCWPLWTMTADAAIFAGKRCTDSPFAFRNLIPSRVMSVTSPSSR